MWRREDERPHSSPGPYRTLSKHVQQSVPPTLIAKKYDLPYADIEGDLSATANTWAAMHDVSSQTELPSSYGPATQ